MNLRKLQQIGPMNNPSPQMWAFLLTKTDRSLWAVFLFGVKMSGNKWEKLMNEELELLYEQEKSLEKALALVREKIREEINRRNLNKPN